jgi:hypothetical protein
MCSICSLHLNAVLKKCLVAIRTIVQQYQVVCILYNVLINFWLCYVIKFTWRIQHRWKTFDATVSPRCLCPFLTILGWKFWRLILDRSSMSRSSSINLSKSTKPLSEREKERKLVVCLFVCLIFWKLDWGHHTINEPVVGKYKVGQLLFVIFSQLTISN